VKIIFVQLFLFFSLASIGQQPVADFSATPTKGCVPLTVNFKDLSSGLGGLPTVYDWDLGNGTIANIPNPTTTYFSSGTYPVRLTITNANGVSTETKLQYITVSDKPIVDFTASSLSGCFPFPTNFTDLTNPVSGTNAAWEWDFGDGLVSTDQNPQHTYTVASNYSVTLKVTNSEGCFNVATKPNYLLVTSGFAMGFTHSVPASCKAPETITFTNTTTGAGTISYKWEFGDGGIDFNANPSHTYNSTGPFNVRLIANSNLGCIDTLDVPASVTLKQILTTFNGPTNLCKGIAGSFSNTSPTPALTSFWDFGDGTTSPGPNASKAWASSGNYNVRLVNTYASCKDSLIKVITIDPPPSPSFSAVDSFNCIAPFTVNFTNAGIAGATYNWDFGDGTTASFNTPTPPQHTYTALGNYTVKLFVVGANGCTDSLIKNQFIRIGRPTITLKGAAKGCTPVSFSPTIVSSPQNVTSNYLWDFGDGTTSTTTTPTHLYTIPGRYTVKLYFTSLGGCLDSFIGVDSVRVGTVPVVNFSAAPLLQCANKIILFTDLSITADEWLWDFGDGTQAFNQGPAKKYIDTGRFNITLKASNNGCPNTLTKINYVSILPALARFTTSINCTDKRKVTFTNTSIAAISNFWDFGDGTTLTTNALTVVHNYPSNGTYSAKLRVGNGPCIDSMVIPVNIVSEPVDFSILKDSICRKDLAYFTAFGYNIANLAQVNTFVWDFGDGSGLTGPAQGISRYNFSGKYTIKLYVVDKNGCRDSIVKTNALVVSGPGVQFNFTPAIGCKPLTVNFTDFSVTDGTYPIKSWYWEYGDNKTDSFTVNQTFPHTYDTTGTFFPYLRIIDNNGCRDSVKSAKAVFVTAPKAAFNSNDSATCIGKNVTFKNASVGNALTYLWSFSNGKTSTAKDTATFYNTDGNYTVKLVVKDVNGCKDSAVKNNFVKVLTGKASFTVKDSISSCSPFEVEFNSTSINAGTVKWDFGDNTNSLNPNYTKYYSIPGIYKAKLILYNAGGCTDTAFKTIKLFDDAAILTYTPIAGCSPLKVKFNVKTAGPVTYFWDMSDGKTFSTTDSNLVYTYQQGGDYLPKVILTDAIGCKIPIKGIDTIVVSKSLIDFKISDSLLCDGGQVTFTDFTKSNDIIANYNWNFGDGSTNTQKNPNHTYSAPGLYNVRLIVNTTNSCADTLTKSSFVKVVASPQASIGGIVPGCIDATINFRGIEITSDTSLLQWRWDFGNGKIATVKDPNPVRYDSLGAYPVELIVTNSSGCADTVTNIVTVTGSPFVNAGPDQTIIAGTTTSLPTTATNNVTYAWMPSTTLSCNNCPIPDATPLGNTNYIVKVTNAFGCSAQDTVSIFVTCTDKNVFIPNTFSPNNDGANDLFYPRGTGLYNIQSMRIFNRWGELVFQKNNFLPNDVNSAWNGVYKGKIANTDVYTYIIEIICNNSNILTYKGNITLIR
jgi:gliding motility-associated-like protein